MSGAIPYLQLGASAFKSYGEYQAGQDAKEVAERNARAVLSQAESEATATREEGREQSKFLREKIRRMGKTQKTSYAKSGVKLQGTPTDVMESTFEEGEADALALLSKYYTSAESTLSAGRQKSAIYKKKGKSAAKAGYISGLATNIEGLASYFS